MDIYFILGQLVYDKAGPIKSNSRFYIISIQYFV